MARKISGLKQLGAKTPIPKSPSEAEIEVARDTCHEGCIYRGPHRRLAAE
jgi:hypothetical protein